MENNSLPESQEFGAKVTELCDGPAKFTNLNLLETFRN
jgi:hypothetical protein